MREEKLRQWTPWRISARVMNPAVLNQSVTRTVSKCSSGSGWEVSVERGMSKNKAACKSRPPELRRTKSLTYLGLLVVVELVAELLVELFLVFFALAAL